VIDTVNDLDNVLYEISNESHPNSQEWQYHMINVIKDYEATKPKQHPVGMTVEFPDGNNDELFASPADWISPNDYADPPPAGGSKVIISDTDHIWGIGGDRDWAWRSFTRGLNVIYMDPWDGEFIPESPNEDLRVNMGYILSYANRMNLGAMTPRPDLCSTGYCLANPAASGAEYLVYLPSGSTATAIMDRLGVDKEPSIYLPLDSRVTVDLSATPGEVSVEWFDPSTGETISGDTAMGGDSRSFSAPSVGDAVLYLHQARPPTVFNIAARRLDTIAWFTWNTDEAASSQVEYGISPTLEISTTETNRYVTSHAVLITGLLPSTDYVYSVRSKDVAGNPTTSEIFGFTTVASEDIKLPRLPVILRVLQAE